MSSQGGVRANTPSRLRFLNVNLREKFTSREIEQERTMRWSECPTKKLAADTERRSFSLASIARSLSLSEATCSRTTAVAAQQHGTTERTGGNKDFGRWFLTYEQERKHCSFFALSLSQVAKINQKSCLTFVKRIRLSFFIKSEVVIT